jgi:hypothetical protein
MYLIKTSRKRRQWKARKKPKEKGQIYPCYLLTFVHSQPDPKKTLPFPGIYDDGHMMMKPSGLPEDKMLIFSAAVSRLAGYVNAEEGGVAPAAVHRVRAPCTE